MNKIELINELKKTFIDFDVEIKVKGKSYIVKINETKEIQFRVNKLRRLFNIDKVSGNIYNLPFVFLFQDKG